MDGSQSSGDQVFIHRYVSPSDAICHRFQFKRLDLKTLRLITSHTPRTLYLPSDDANRPRLEQTRVNLVQSAVTLESGS